MAATVSHVGTLPDLLLGGMILLLGAKRRTCRGDSRDNGLQEALTHAVIGEGAAQFVKLLALQRVPPTPIVLYVTVKPCSQSSVKHMDCLFNRFGTSETAS